MKKHVIMAPGAKLDSERLSHNMAKAALVFEHTNAFPGGFACQISQIGFTVRWL